MCTCSVRRYAKLIGFRNRSAVRAPFIREENLVKRSEWALCHHLWAMTQWSRVIFTEESSFEVRLMKRNMRVWRKAGERFGAACMVPTYKSGYELVNVWGAFCYYGKPPLVRIDGTFSNEECIESGKLCSGRGQLVRFAICRILSYSRTTAARAARRLCASICRN